MIMKRLNIEPGQNILDVSMQEYYTAEDAIKIMIDNQMPGIVSPIPSSLIIYPKDTPDVVGQVFTKRNIGVKTGDGVLLEFESIGIGNWSISSLINPFVVL